MRAFALSMFLLASGCQCFAPRCAVESCPSPKAVCETTPEKFVREKAVCEKPPSARAEAECVEAPPIRVKVPPAQVIVQTPPPTTVSLPQSATPQMVAAPQATFAPGVGNITGVSEVPVGRSRLGFTFDFVRIPLPIIRPIAVPVTSEVTVSGAAPQAVFAAPQAVFAAPQAVAVPQTVFAAPQAVASPQMASVPVQGHAMVPVQGQAMVPVQGQAMMSMPTQAVTPQTVMMSQAAPQVMMTPQAAVAQAAPAARPITEAEAEEICRQLNALKTARQQAALQIPPVN